MRWRWLWFDYSDPDLPLSLRQRLRIAFRWVPIWRMPRGIWRGRIIFSLLILPMAILPQVAFSLLPPLPPWQIYLYALVPALWLPMFWVWTCIMYGAACRREHLHRIRLEGFDVCIECGYWLRGLGDEVSNCPECGATRERIPAVTSPEPEQRS